MPPKGKNYYSNIVSLENSLKILKDVFFITQRTLPEKFLSLNVFITHGSAKTFFIELYAIRVIEIVSKTSIFLSRNLIHRKNNI